MGKVINLKEYKTKQSTKYRVVKHIDSDIPTIYITKEGKCKYNVIINDCGEDTLFNAIPIPKLSIAIYAASYCKDKLSEYFDEYFSTDIIIFDEECAAEMNRE